ncbi:MAG: zinc transport system substrate-binding protein [Sulfurospirillum sp.]|jgi:zinc transport system substrate-binding protein|nr:zinc transport system substrate-binding protein [Sulfurospirillum sp.]
MRLSRKKGKQMKKLILSLLLLVSSNLLAKVNAVVSIIPQQTILEQIGGDKVEITLMVTPGNSPHTYEPKPAQMREIEKANLYFTIGVEFEKAWLDKFVAQNGKMKVISVAKGIEKLPMKEHSHEGHEHKAHDDHEHANTDPHVWTSPENVKIIATNIYEALLRVDKAHKEYYFKNLENFLAKVDALNEKIMLTLKDTPKGTKFMVFHPSWGYFAKQYDLEQIAIEVSGKEPKPKELMHIIEEAKEENIKALFTQPEFSDKSATIIAKELQVPVIKVSPLAKNWEEQLLKIAQSIANK